MRDLVLGEEYEGQIGHNGDAPDGHDDLDDRRACDERARDQRLADDKVALARDHQNGENGGDAHRVLNERDQIAQRLAQVPALFGEQLRNIPSTTTEHN